MLRSLLPRGLLAAVCALAVPAQDRIPLPQGAGSLQALPGWTTAEATDQPDPARALLAATQKALRERRSQEEHTLVHAAGSKSGELRLVNCYSSPGPLGRAELADPAFVDRLRVALEQNLAAAGAKVQSLGSRQPALYPTGSLALEFALTSGELTLRVEHHAVPAGDRIQNFEATWFEHDVDARGEVEALLRTFDGAREGREDRTLQTMLLGGLCGGVLGVVMARRRQRRRAEIAADAGR